MEWNADFVAKDGGGGEAFCTVDEDSRAQEDLFVGALVVGFCS